MAIVHNTLKHFKTFLIPILFFPVCPILIFFCFHISYRAQQSTVLVLFPCSCIIINDVCTGLIHKYRNDDSRTETTSQPRFAEVMGICMSPT